MSGSVGELLKAAAEQVAVEDQQAAEEALVVAADQLNRSQDFEASIDAHSRGEKASLNAEPRLMERDDDGRLVDAKISENVHALLEDMKMKPKYGGRVEDDVDALLAMQRKKERSRSASPRSADERPPARAPAPALPKRRIPKQKPKRPKRSPPPSDYFVAEPSRVAVLLSEADEKDWMRAERLLQEQERREQRAKRNDDEKDDDDAGSRGSRGSRSTGTGARSHYSTGTGAADLEDAELRRSIPSSMFASARQEQLFRSMRVVRPRSAGSGKRAARSSRPGGSSSSIVEGGRSTASERDREKGKGSAEAKSYMDIEAEQEKGERGGGGGSRGRGFGTASYSRSVARLGGGLSATAPPKSLHSSSMAEPKTSSFRVHGHGQGLGDSKSMFIAAAGPSTNASTAAGVGPGAGGKGQVDRKQRPRVASSLTPEEADYLLNIHTYRPPEVRPEDQRRRKQEVQKMRQSSERLYRTGAGASKEPSAIDKQIDPTLAHSTFSDAKECTFMPNYKEQQRRKARQQRKRREEGNDDDEHKTQQDAQFAFINRQEAEERNRRDELQFQMGKADYDARVDKKRCPQCGAKQSYDEFKEKRKTCPNCRIEYCAAVSWERVGGRFLRKSQQFAQQAAEKKERLRQEQGSEYKYIRRTAYDPAAGRTVTYEEPAKERLTPEEEAAFFDRLAQRLERREREVQQLEHEVYEKPYPFKPTISQFAQRRHEQQLEEQEDSDQDPAEQFLKRYAQDLEERQERFPQKYVRSRYLERRREDDDLEPFRVTTAGGQGINSHSRSRRRAGNSDPSASGLYS